MTSHENTPLKDHPLYDEVTSFLSSGPAPEDIVRFQPSEANQRRASDLLSRLKGGNLTPEEEAELDKLEQIEHFMRIIKAKARLHLKEALPATEPVT
ncbi:MAG: hypothetical protein A3F84_26605 [Candidatus Handelsmanbacteria bacterium RIFCSPLOWO2_12_FULL_64_10]|uniref:Uncharacterized protein n=1 Tax=Handelsmanbacteria sp. (strain RIFCSPLOWO2_12_FULL_64_10) TaxID=1817868 RepID=A0A1F6CQL9_HANXR|nr:MAG: hypothetical protein A3F84_26605 [Candidatus Handelsmanbacteria bacterium RIFCSPLOWO2_12_FULL_64_10]